MDGWNHGNFAYRFWYKSEKNISFVTMGVQDTKAFLMSKSQYFNSTQVVGSGSHSELFYFETSFQSFRFDGLFLNMFFSDAGYGGIQALFDLFGNQVEENHLCAIETAGVDYV